MKGWIAKKNRLKLGYRNASHLKSTLINERASVWMIERKESLSELKTDLADIVHGQFKVLWDKKSENIKIKLHMEKGLKRNEKETERMVKFRCLGSYIKRERERKTWNSEKERKHSTHLTKHTQNYPRLHSWIWISRDKHKLNVFTYIKGQYLSDDFQLELPTWKIKKSVALLPRLTVPLYIQI